MRYDTGLIELGDSELHGLGVFAKKDIKKGQIIEYCPVLRYKSVFPLPSIFDAYCFDDPYDDEHASGLQLGFGGLYNSSHTGDGMDAFPIYDDDKKMYQWIAVKDIPKDKEILTWYGNDFTIESIGEEQVLLEWARVEEVLETLGIRFSEENPKSSEWEMTETGSDTIAESVPMEEIEKEFAKSIANAGKAREEYAKSVIDRDG